MDFDAASLSGLGRDDTLPLDKLSDFSGLECGYFVVKSDRALEAGVICLTNGVASFDLRKI